MCIGTSLPPPRPSGLVARLMGRRGKTYSLTDAPAAAQIRGGGGAAAAAEARPPRTYILGRVGSSAAHKPTLNVAVQMGSNVGDGVDPMSPLPPSAESTVPPPPPPPPPVATEGSVCTRPRASTPCRHLRVLRARQANASSRTTTRSRTPSSARAQGTAASTPSSPGLDTSTPGLDASTPGNDDSPSRDDAPADAPDADADTQVPLTGGGVEQRRSSILNDRRSSVSADI